MRAEGVTDLHEYLKSSPEKALEHFALIEPIYRNEKAAETFDASDRDELIARFAETLIPETAGPFSDFLAAVFQGARRFGTESKHVTLAGRQITISIQARFFRCGENLMKVCTVTEVSDRVNVEQTLSQLQSRYEVALRETEMGVWEWNLTENKLVFDCEYGRILGYSSDELNNNPEIIVESVHPDDKLQTEALVDEVIRGKRNEYFNVHRMRKKNGSYLWIRSHGRVCEHSHDGKPIRAVGTMCEINSEVHNREFLKIERLIFQSSTSGIPILTIFNTVANRIEEVYPDFRVAIHVLDDAGQFIEYCAAPTLGDDYKKVAIGFDVLNTASACQRAVKKRKIEIVPDFSKDEAFEIVAQAFKSFGICGCSSIPILSSNESPIGTMCLYSRTELDKSELELLGLERISRSLALIYEKEKQIERQSQLQTQAQNRQKFESLGQMAGGIAHDFNNLLLSIICNAELIELQASDHPETVKCADEIIRASSVAANICRQMLAYAGKAESTRAAIHLNEVLSEITTLVRSATTHTIQITVECDDELPAIIGDASALSQVFMNLLTNAVDAIPESNGQIFVTAGTGELDQSQLDELMLGNQLSPGPYVFASVSDNGPGFDPSISTKVFDPFFTTKQTGRGLGLATVLGIVEQHGGAIDVDSVPGHGTCFTLYFPQAEIQQNGSPRDSTTIPSSIPCGQRILVVDDHNFVRQSIRKNFESEGCEVAIAESGQSAIEMIRQEKFDYVLLDLIMPGLSGLGTYRLIREFDQETPVCFMTGFAANSEIEKVVRIDPSAKLIRKPFQRHELIRLVANSNETGV